MNEKIVKVGSKTKDHVKFLFRDYNIFVASHFDLSCMNDTLGYPNFVLKSLCEVFLNVQFNPEMNAAYVGIELFKLFAERVQPRDAENQDAYLQRIIEKYTFNHFNVKYIGKVHMKRAIPLMVDNRERCSLFIQTLKLYVMFHYYYFCFIYIECRLKFTMVAIKLFKLLSSDTVKSIACLASIARTLIIAISLHYN